MWWHTVTTQRQRVNRLALYCASCTIEWYTGNALNRDQESFESCHLAADGRYPLSCLHLVSRNGPDCSEMLRCFYSVPFFEKMTTDKCNGTCEHTFFIGILGLWSAWLLKWYCHVRNTCSCCYVHDISLRTENTCDLVREIYCFSVTRFQSRPRCQAPWPSLLELCIYRQNCHDKWAWNWSLSMQTWTVF